MQQLTYTIDQIAQAAQAVATHLSHAQVVTFTGTIGAGKTTLIRQLLRDQGVTSEITSPTFTYLNVYKVPQHTFYHFDLYRLSSLLEFQQAGFDEYLYVEGSTTIVEWPDIIRPLLSHRVCHIVIEYQEEKRQLRVDCCNETTSC